MNEDVVNVIEYLFNKACPDTKNMLGAAFNQDWALDFNSWESVIDEYYCDGKSNALIIEELDSLVSHLSEAEIKIIFDCRQTSIEPQVEGYSYKGWLQAVLTILKSAESKI